MKKASFWEKETFNKPCDLIIIGAGIVGLSSALFHKRANPQARVLVVDKGMIPEGASTRNAGFACVGSITEHVADMQKTTQENIKKRIKLRYEGLQLLRETLGDADIGYENCGGYEIFTSPQTFDEAAEHIPQFNRWLKEVTGQPEVYVNKQLNGYPVIYNRLEGALHPGRMMQQLVKEVTLLGVEIRWNTKVEKVNGNSSVTLKKEGELQSSQVLVASNGFTKRLLPGLNIMPARGFVMVSEPWPENPWKGSFNYDRGYIYFRNVGNQLLLGGARNVAAEEETLDSFGVNEIIKTHLLNFAKDILRLPDTISIEHEWSGIMGFTPTKTPVLKRLDDFCVVATGLSGMGISIGMKVGKEAARLLENK